MLFLRFQRLMHPGDPGAGAAGDPPAPTPKPGEPPKPAAGDQPPAGGKPDDQKGMVPVAEVAEERQKRHALEGEVKGLKDQLEGFKNSIATALGIKKEDDPAKAAEGAKAESDRMKSIAENSLAKAAVIAAAGRKGAVDPEAVFKLGDVGSLKIDIEKMTVDGADALVDAVLKDKPYLATKPAPTPSGGKPPASDPNPGSLDLKEVEENEAKAMKGDPEAIKWVTRNLNKIAAVKAKK